MKTKSKKTKSVSKSKSKALGAALAAIVNPPADKKAKPNHKNGKAKVVPTTKQTRREGLPKLRAAALKALKIDPFNASVLRQVIATCALPYAKRNVVTNAINGHNHSNRKPTIKAADKSNDKRKAIAA